MLPQNNRPYVLAPGEGSLFWTLNLPGQAKAIGEQTSGRYSLVEALCPPGYATPLHIHYLEDEAVYVLEGHLTIVAGGQTMRVLPGSYIFLPRGIAHGFRVSPQAPARILLLTTPAAMDQCCLPVETPESVLPESAAMEIETLADLAAKYKIDVLGPLPDATT
jgi:quercetin dioxygenase-like cupin family protein